MGEEAAFWAEWPLYLSAGQEGLTRLERLRRPVPSHHSGRKHWHREYFAVVEFLAFLHSTCPDAFPLRVEKCEAPDFVLYPNIPSTSIALEHTEATVPQYLEWEARNTEGISLTWSPDKRWRKSRGKQAQTPGRSRVELPSDGWAGSAVQQHLNDVLERAMCPKLDEKRWENAPAGSARAVLFGDATGVEGTASDAEIYRALQRTLWIGNQHMPTLRNAFLVRGCNRVIAARSLGS